MNDLLEQLIFNGYATKDYEFFDGKLKFTLKTLIGDEQLDIESEMADEKGTTNRILHVYSLKMLAHSIQKYNEHDLSKMDPAKRYEFLKKLSNVMLDKLIETQTKFERECKGLVSPESLENFSKTPQTDIE